MPHDVPMPAAQQEPMILGMCSLLAKEIGLLHDEVSILEERLSQVLTPASTNEADESPTTRHGDPKTDVKTAGLSMSPMADFLSDKVALIAKANNRVSAIRNRLEL